MKRILNGVTYNTHTSTVVARYEWVDDNTGIQNDVSVYKTRGGAFFRVYSWNEGEDQKHYFEALDREALDKMVTTIDNLEIVDSAAIEEPPEAAAEASPEATVFTRVPATLKRRIDDAAKGESQSTNSYSLKCLERCVGMGDTIRRLASALYFLEGLPEAIEEGGDLRPTISSIISEIKLAAANLGVADLLPGTPKARPITARAG